MISFRSELSVFDVENPIGNCPVEGVNFYLNTKIGIKPNMFDAIERIKDLNDKYEAEYDQINFGLNRVNFSNAKEKKKNSKIKMAKELLTRGGSILNYLEALRIAFHGNNGDDIPDLFEAGEEDNNAVLADHNMEDIVDLPLVTAFNDRRLHIFPGNYVPQLRPTHAITGTEAMVTNTIELPVDINLQRNNDNSNYAMVVNPELHLTGFPFQIIIEINFVKLSLI
jgi:hypothetical protein